MSDSDREWLYRNAVGMSAGLVGWFLCSMFASVAYNWTFYYILALIVAAHQLTRDRVVSGRALQAQTVGGRFSATAGLSAVK